MDIETVHKRILELRDEVKTHQSENFIPNVEATIRTLERTGNSLQIMLKNTMDEGGNAILTMQLQAINFGDLSGIADRNVPPVTYESRSNSQEDLALPGSSKAGQAGTITESTPARVVASSTNPTQPTVQQPRPARLFTVLSDSDPFKETTGMILSLEMKKQLAQELRSENQLNQNEETVKTIMKTIDNIITQANIEYKEKEKKIKEHYESQIVENKMDMDMQMEKYEAETKELKDKAKRYKNQLTDIHNKEANMVKKLEDKDQELHQYIMEIQDKHSTEQDNNKLRRAIEKIKKEVREVFDDMTNQISKLQDELKTEKGMRTKDKKTSEQEKQKLQDKINDL